MTKASRWYEQPTGCDRRRLDGRQRNPRNVSQSATCLLEKGDLRSSSNGAKPQSSRTRNNSCQPSCLQRGQGGNSDANFRLRVESSLTTRTRELRHQQSQQRTRPWQLRCGSKYRHAHQGTKESFLLWIAG